MVKKESAVAKKVQKSQIEEIVEQLLEKGRKSGVLTQSEISDALHEQTEITAEQLDDIYTTLGKLNVEIVADIDADDTDSHTIETDEDEDEVVLYGEFAQNSAIQKYLEEQQYDIVSGEFTRIPVDTKELTSEQRAEVDKILDKLDEDDDVTNVYHNIKE